MKQKSKNFDRFIGFYRNYFPENFIEESIDLADKLFKNNNVDSRKDSENAPEHFKNDFQIFNNKIYPNPFIPKFYTDQFTVVLEELLNDYVERFFHLQTFPLKTEGYKIQITPPGGGYHVWHSEIGQFPHDTRVITFMLYLNDLGDDGGGETEFYYQRMRVKPEKNLFLLWPASYTHPHRGNINLSNRNKYIITGWFHVFS